MPLCLEIDCIKCASFGYPNCSPLYCKTHSQSDMVNLKVKNCINIDCSIQASFGYKNERATCCKKHKLTGMTYINKNKCLECDKRGIYNYSNCKRGIYCKKHSEDDMVIVFKKYCKYKNCKKSPSFNFKGQKSVEYCSMHKIPGMINIQVHYCEDTNCTKQAIFNYKGEKRGIRCKTHMFCGMVNVKDKKKGIKHQAPLARACKYDISKLSNLLKVGKMLLKEDKCDKLLILNKVAKKMLK